MRRQLLPMQKTQKNQMKKPTGASMSSEKWLNMSTTHKSLTFYLTLITNQKM